MPWRVLAYEPQERSGPDIHQPTFVVDEGCIPVGLKVLAEVATTFERVAISTNFTVGARVGPRPDQGEDALSRGGWGDKRL